MKRVSKFRPSTAGTEKENLEGKLVFFLRQKNILKHPARRRAKYLRYSAGYFSDKDADDSKDVVSLPGVNMRLFRRAMSV